MRTLSRWDRALGRTSRLVADVASRGSTIRHLADRPTAASKDPPTLRGVAEIAAGGSGEAGEPPEQALDAQERRHSAALMRVNHVGEVCAQALYRGQAATATDEALRAFLLGAAEEERQHLEWTARRLEELSGQPSRLVGFWYSGSYLLGAAAGLGGEAVSLGFMAETERQVEAHLASHLERLPAADRRSREIVLRMQADEVAHGQGALARGGRLPPWPLRSLMRAMARVMTRTAYRI